MNFTSHVNVDEGPPNGPEKQPSRFQSEFKTNVKQEEQLEHQKPGPSSLLQPKAESVSTAPLFRRKEDPAPLPPYNHASVRKDNQEARAEAEPMDIELEEEGDYVVREIDVYFKPSLSDESARVSFIFAIFSFARVGFVHFSWFIFLCFAYIYLYFLKPDRLTYSIIFLT